jgi:transcription elongation factor Elf1
MNHAESKNPTLSGSDILFECGQCGKSLSIDCRGAGLNVPCPQCGSELEVPIPEGFDLAELDKEISASAESDEELKAITGPVDTETVSSGASGQINKLMAELEALRAQRRYLEQQHANMLKTIKAVTREVGEFHKALDDLASMLDNLTGAQADETQKIG